MWLPLQKVNFSCHVGGLEVDWFNILSNGHAGEVCFLTLTELCSWRIYQFASSVVLHTAFAISATVFSIEHEPMRHMFPGKQTGSPTNFE